MQGKALFRLACDGSQLLDTSDVLEANARIIQKPEVLGGEVSLQPPCSWTFSMTEIY